MKNIKLVLIFFPLVFLLSNCSENTVDITNPLFAVTSPEYRPASQDNRCKLGGVYFDLYNKADCSIVYMETRMNVFDRKSGKSAFTGYGTIETASEVIIKKRETKQMCVPLDDYITIEAEEGYLIDQFYINYIEYEDGRIWKDDFGLYAAGGK